MEPSEQDSDSDQPQQQQQKADGCQDGVVVESTTDDRQSKPTTTTKKNGDEEDGTPKRKLTVACTDCCCCPQRYVVVLLLFLGMCFVHAQRVNVGVTVVAIVDDRHQTVSVQISETPDNNTSVIVTKDSSVRFSCRCCVATLAD